MPIYNGTMRIVADLPCGIVKAYMANTGIEIPIPYKAVVIGTNPYFKREFITYDDGDYMVVELEDEIGE